MSGICAAPAKYDGLGCAYGKMTGAIFCWLLLTTDKQLVEIKNRKSKQNFCLSGKVVPARIELTSKV